MSTHRVNLEKHEVQELEQSLEFLRKFHPHFWDLMDEDEICNMLQITHKIFKANPAILAATNNQAISPVQ